MKTMKKFDHIPIKGQDSSRVSNKSTIRIFYLQKNVSCGTLLRSKGKGKQIWLCFAPPNLVGGWGVEFIHNLLIISSSSGGSSQFL